MARIDGLAQLQRKFKQMTPAVREAAKAAVIKGAEELAAMQRSLAPVDDGGLRNSIHVTMPGETTPPYSQPGGRRTAFPEEAIVTAGNTHVRYAHLVEFGTAPHVQGGQFAGTQHPGTRPQPFFWPSYRALRRRIQSRITRSINKAIKTEAGK